VEQREEPNHPMLWHSPAGDEHGGLNMLGVLVAPCSVERAALQVGGFQDVPPVPWRNHVSIEGKEPVGFLTEVELLLTKSHRCGFIKSRVILVEDVGLKTLDVVSAAEVVSGLVLCIGDDDEAVKSLVPETQRVRQQIGIAHTDCNSAFHGFTALA